MKHSWLKGKNMLLAAALAFVFTSCADGFEDESSWAPSVKNAQLESPAASGIKVVFSPDGLTHTISWSVVLGAGGYAVTVYNVDDPLNPVLVGEEGEVVDGLTTTRPAKDDTKYKVLIKALGYEKYNNKEALTPTEKLYTNLLNSSAPPIPNNTDLAEYFRENPIPATCDSTLCFDLEAGGTFFINDTINHKMSSLLIRGDKMMRAKIVINSKGSFVNGGAGFKLQFVDVDYPESSAEPLIAMDPNFNKPDSTLSVGAKGGYFLVPASSPIVLQECTFTNMKSSLFIGNDQKYAISALLVKECVVGYNADFKQSVFFSGTTSNQNGGNNMMIKDLTLTNSTFYNEQKAGSYFLRFQGGRIDDVGAFPSGEVWSGGNLTVSGCTFFQMGYLAQMANFRSNEWKTDKDKITLEKCVFVNSFNDQSGNVATSTGIVRRIRSSSDTPQFVAGYNSYWYEGAFLESEVTHAQGDKTATVIKTDPGLTFNGAGAIPLFTMGGSAQVAAGAGDPRWLSGGGE